MFASEFYRHAGEVRSTSGITSVITEPERAIIHFKNTRKSGFACITLLFRILVVVDQLECYCSAHAFV